MTDRAYQLLKITGDIERLDRRLQLNPQPLVRKSPNPLGGPQWMVAFGNAVYGADTWETAITTAIRLHKRSCESNL